MHRRLTRGKREGRNFDLTRALVYACYIVLLPILTGCSWWWNQAPAAHDTQHASQPYLLPKDATGTIVIQHTSATWLLYSSHQPIQIPAGQFISISPGGAFLLIDGRRVFNVQTGRYVGSIPINTYIPGLYQSLWLSPQRVVLGSFSKVGLYSAALHGPPAQMLTPGCQLDASSAQPINIHSQALLCLTASGKLAILSYRHMPGTLTPISLHPPAPANARVQYVSEASWTPDEQHIIFSWGTSVGSTPPDSSEIVTVGQYGTAFTTLVSASPGQFCALPTFSPDGQQLAYVKRVVANSNGQQVSFTIHLLTLTTHQDQVVASGTGPGPSTLAWSPDGSYLAYDAPSTNGQPGSVTLVQTKSSKRFLLAQNATLVGWA